MVYIVEGNVLDATQDIIAHQVNCKGIMGAGVAKAIKFKHYDVFVRYRKHCLIAGADLLGKIQMLKVTDDKYICNMFAQDGFGRDKQYTDEKAFTLCVTKLFDYASKNHLTVAMPYGIGCGLGGADWNSIYKTILRESTMRDVDVTFYKI